MSKFLICMPNQLNIVIIIKSRNMTRWEKRTEMHAEEGPKGKRPLEILSVDGRFILKWSYLIGIAGRVIKVQQFCILFS